MITLAEVVRTELRLHPRVAYQGLCDSAQYDRLVQTLPPLVPFGSTPYVGLLAILDWDHRLPSRNLVFRVYAYTSDDAFARGKASFERRLEEIAAQDRYPEFDVPDFDALLADESYESELALGGQVERLRLVSAWRRDFPEAQAKAAVDIARQSQEFQTLRTETTGRPPFLGDLEAVAWCPPCESGCTAWTLDVWYLTAFDGQIGKGVSLLVGVGEGRVLGVREFAVRAS